MPETAPKAKRIDETQMVKVKLPVRGAFFPDILAPRPWWCFKLPESDVFPVLKEPDATKIQKEARNTKIPAERNIPPITPERAAAFVTIREVASSDPTKQEIAKLIQARLDRIKVADDDFGGKNFLELITTEVLKNVELAIDANNTKNKRVETINKNEDSDKDIIDRIRDGKGLQGILKNVFKGGISLTACAASAIQAMQKPEIVDWITNHLAFLKGAEDIIKPFIPVAVAGVTWLVMSIYDASLGIAIKNVRNSSQKQREREEGKVYEYNRILAKNLYIETFKEAWKSDQWKSYFSESYPQFEKLVNQEKYGYTAALEWLKMKADAEMHGEHTNDLLVHPGMEGLHYGIFQSALIKAGILRRPLVVWIKLNLDQEVLSETVVLNPVERVSAYSQ